MLSFLIIRNMAKSKSGGTRSYLRGRIASDVYSIGRDSSGKKQQVVRSLAEQVANPQTIAQMRGRMIMSTVMQAVSGLKSIIDHSFDGIPTGQPSISEFIRRNYGLIKSDVDANPSGGNNFGLSKYQEKGIKPGAYVVSAGSAILPSAVKLLANVSCRLQVEKTAEVTTAAQIRALLGMGAEDYITAVGIYDNGKAVFFRVRVNLDLADDTVITSDNLKQLFVVENPLGMNIQYQVSDTAIVVGDLENAAFAWSNIFTKKTETGFTHSDTTLLVEKPLSYKADDALPTYPIGEERFLNGGEI